MNAFPFIPCQFVLHCMGAPRNRSMVGVSPIQCMSRARPPERKRKSVTASAARKRQRKAEEDAALRRLQPIAARIAAEVPPAPPTRDPSFYKNAPDAEFLAWFGLRDTAPSPADQNALIPSR